MRSNKFLTFIFSFIPGAAHMYLGFQKKGIQIMLLFFSLLFLGNFLRTDMFLILLPIVWFYSFFDVRKAFNHSDTFVDEIKYFSLINFELKYLGYFLIFAGIIGLINGALFPILSVYLDWRIIQTIKDVLMSLILIIIGIKLISGKKVHFQEYKRLNPPSDEN
ncbi:hypothetical protein K144313037_02610 [Clostridium tetani]|uniref:Conserved protein n=1 Tax=Clostridium tetani (strain Massachusetts / E88) TaxID=212717 RepID=Q898L2_CLOTE|nr:hypothetical protein [Clostridium tetani]AAO35067.1 conserved protein [Clostridium tetani E88]AVP54960.1 hypothetical protein C3B72_07325 [Clostridium tetani]QBD84172.1 hypothetical protein EQG73_02155 [Clostridium tetani]RXI52902.1 hypothetical protein DP124_07210 [Clostridium tetani]RXI55818.1 hypothetical protein DP122_04080 [Clostridium tetani]